MAEEQDEVAAYLARERAALGDDAELFAAGGAPPTAKDVAAKPGSGMDAFPDLDNMDSTPAEASKPSSSEPKGIDAFPDLMDGQETGYDVRVTGVAGTGEDPEREKFESAFPDIQPGPQEPSAIPYGASPYPSKPYDTSSTTQQQSTYSSVLPAPAFAATQVLEEEETEPVREWRAKQAEEIKQRDERSKHKREETILKAEKAIDAFYEKYNAEKEKTIRENKENEAKFLSELSDSMGKGTSWERVTDIIELQNSQSKTIRPSAPGGSDLARMKELLLSLRREGDRAPAAAGF